MNHGGLTNPLDIRSHFLCSPLMLSLKTPTKAVIRCITGRLRPQQRQPLKSLVRPQQWRLSSRKSTTCSRRWLMLISNFSLWLMISILLRRVTFGSLIFSRKLIRETLLKKGILKALVFNNDEQERTELWSLPVSDKKPVLKDSDDRNGSPYSISNEWCSALYFNRNVFIVALLFARDSLVSVRPHYRTRHDFARAGCFESYCKHGMERDQVFQLLRSWNEGITVFLIIYTSKSASG